MRFLIHLLLVLLVAFFVSFPALAQGVGDKIVDAVESVEEVRDKIDEAKEEDDDEEEDEDDEDKDDD